MIEFAIWIFAGLIGCLVASVFFFTFASPTRTTMWFVLGILTEISAVGFGIVLAIMGLNGLIEYVATAMGF